jgi:transcriptional regulator of acetoin/glycerol metabolism
MVPKSFVRGAILLERLAMDNNGGGKNCMGFGVRRFNEYFVDNLRSNTRAGLKAARARGRVGGRPKALDTSKQQMAQALRRDTTLSIDDICKQLGVSRSTFYRYTQG